MSDSHSGDKSTNPGDTRIPHTERWGEEVPLPEHVLRSRQRVEPIFPSDPAAALREIICRKHGSVQFLMLAASPPDFQRWIDEAWEAWRERLPAAQPPPKRPIVGSDAHQALDALEDLMRELNRLFPPTPSAQEERSGAVSDPAIGERSEAEGRCQRKRGGGTRPPLEKSNPLQFQVYQRIRQAHGKGEKYLNTIERLKSDKQFLEQVHEAKLKLNCKLVRKALAFIDQRERRRTNNQQVPPA